MSLVQLINAYGKAMKALGKAEERVYASDGDPSFQQARERAEKSVRILTKRIAVVIGCKP